MERNKMSAIAMIAVILGAVGLGAGAYSIISVQTGAVKGDNGDDGDDGDDGASGVTTIVYNTENEYPCSSQSEIENALDTIGTGNGIITITENIILSSTIDIDNGGTYIIRGAGQITLNRNADDEAINITNTQSLTLKDLSIDTSDIISSTISGIYVNEENDNPVYIQNIQVGGGVGRGIYINSKNVWIENSIFNNLRYGIYLDTDSAFCHILDNSLLNTKFVSSDHAYGIYIKNSDHNTVSGNLVKNLEVSGGGRAYGIHVYESNSTTLTGNTVDNITSYGSNSFGISLENAYYTAITSNSINNISSTPVTVAVASYGIRLWTSYHNTISTNIITNINATGSNGYAYAINCYASEHNTISDNIIDKIKSGNDANGVVLYNSLHNTVIGNIIIHVVSVSERAYGIIVNWYYNIICSNSVGNIQGGDRGYGIYISGSNNIITENVAYNCNYDGISIAVSNTEDNNIEI